jgi:hypothetical protein
MKTNDVVRFLFISPVIDDDYVLSWGYVSLEVISVYGLGKNGVNRNHLGGGLVVKVWD